MNEHHNTMTTAPAVQRQRLLATFAYFAVFVALGLGVTLGPTLQGLAAHTRTSLSAISILFSARAFGYMVGSFLSGRLYDRRPGHPVIAAALVVMAVTLFLTPVMARLWLLVAVIAVLGVAEGSVDVGGNTMLLWTHGSRVGPYMNGLHFCWGVGAFLSPIIIAQTVLASGDITLGYWIIALLMLPPVLFLIRLPSPHAHTHAADRPNGPLNVKLLLLIMLFYFTYVGAEATFGGWIYTYATALGQADKVTAAYLTSLFWGALTLGRLLSVPVATRLHPGRVLLIDLVGCLLSLAFILALPGVSLVLWLGAFGTGLFMASMFPTMISFADRRMAVTGQITGLFLFASAAGGMTIPWFVGQFFEIAGPAVTIVLVFACTCVQFVAFLAVLRTPMQAVPGDRAAVASADAPTAG